MVRVRHGQDGELAVAEVELVAVLHGDDGVVAREVDALEAVVGHGGVGDALFRHEDGVEVGVVGRVVEVVVGVDDVLDGLVGQGLGVGADVARAVTAVDHDGELIAGELAAVHVGEARGGSGERARDEQAAAGQRLGESLLPDSLAVHG